MQTAGQGSWVSHETLPVQTTSRDEEMEHTEAKPISRLVEGEEVLVKINPKSMLLYIMNSLGSKTEPIFSEIDCGGNSVKVSIKLDVSDLSTVSQERIMFSVAEGKPSFNARLAETSAVMKAFTQLQEKHLIRISDFSSGMVVRYESCGIYGLVCEGMDLLQKMFSEWDMSFQYCESSAMKLIGKEFTGTVAGVLSDIGKIYALVGDDLSDILTKLKLKTDEARSELKQLETDLKEYENSMAQTDEMAHINGALHHVDLAYTDILSFVMSFFDLDEAEFTNGPDGNGMVISSVLMKFPKMEKHRFSGNLSLSAKAYSSIEAYKEVAFEALVFIEKHFPVKIIDFNFSKRQKTLEQLNRLIGHLNKILALGVAVRMFWSRLNNVLEGNAELFRFDPLSIFPGNLCQGQIEAYRFCSIGLEDVKQYSLTHFATCGLHIEALQKLTWKLVLLKSKFNI